MSRRFAWVALFAGALLFLIGVYLLLAFSGVFGDPEMKLREDPFIGGLFSWMLDLNFEFMGRTMYGEWERTLRMLKLMSVIPLLIGAVLAWLGLASLVSPEDWKRR